MTENGRKLTKNDQNLTKRDQPPKAPFIFTNVKPLYFTTNDTITL